MIDIARRQNQHLTRLYRLHTEVPPIRRPKAILLKAKLVWFPLLIMDQRSHIDYNIFCAKVLLATDPVLKALSACARREHHWVNDGEHLVLQVGHDERSDTPNGQIEAVDRVAFLIEVGGFGVELLLEPRTNPSDEVAINVNLLEYLEILKAFLVDLLAHFQSQVQRQLLDELVQTLITRLCIVLKSLPNVIVERY